MRLLIKIYWWCYSKFYWLRRDLRHWWLYPYPMTTEECLAEEERHYRYQLKLKAIGLSPRPDFLEAVLKKRQNNIAYLKKAVLDQKLLELRTGLRDRTEEEKRAQEEELRSLRPDPNRKGQLISKKGGPYE